MCDQQSLRSACAYAQSDQSLCWSLEYSMTTELLTEQPCGVSKLTRSFTGSSESTLVKCHIVGNHVSRLIYVVGAKKNPRLRGSSKTCFFKK